MVSTLYIITPECPIALSRWSISSDFFLNSTTNNSYSFNGDFNIYAWFPFGSSCVFNVSVWLVVIVSIVNQFVYFILKYANGYDIFLLTPPIISHVYTGYELGVDVYKSGYPNECKNSCVITPAPLFSNVYVFSILYVPIFLFDQFLSAP